jgi:hypothetical protein
MTIFPTKVERPSVYSVNYPKPLDISLRTFVVGPNVEYSLKNMKGETPTYWINKVNKTTLTIDHPTPVSDIHFFHTDVVPYYG